MIELTEQQLNELAIPRAIPTRVVNPKTNETFILLPVGEYERLKEQQYDDSSWQRDELQAMAWEVAERTDWDEYDDASEKS